MTKKHARPGPARPFVQSPDQDQTQDKDPIEGARERVALGAASRLAGRKRPFGLSRPRRGDT